MNGASGPKVKNARQITPSKGWISERRDLDPETGFLYLHARYLTILLSPASSKPYTGIPPRPASAPTAMPIPVSHPPRFGRPNDFKGPFRARSIA
jgi:hypothetical protein